jgi:hypothetical protein
MAKPKIVKQFERIIFEPVTLEELKLFLKIENDADDQTLTLTRKAARQWVEAYTSCNWALKEVTYAVRGATDAVELRGFELVSITKQDLTPVTPLEVVIFDGVNIVADFQADEIYLITVKDGQETPPEAITEAIKKLASMYYFERETTGSGTQDLKTLLMPFRKFLFV